MTVTESTLTVADTVTPPSWPDTRVGQVALETRFDGQAARGGAEIAQVEGVTNVEQVVVDTIVEQVEVKEDECQGR